MKPSKMLELVENLKVGERVVIEKFKDHLFVEKKKSEVKQFEPKEGDVVYQKKDTYSFISMVGRNNNTTFHLVVEKNVIRYNSSELEDDEVEATDTQKQLLFDRLAKDGKKWNPETKQLEDLDEPKEGDLCILWDDEENDDAVLTKATEFSFSMWNNYIKWDGTAEQFDRIREGGNK